MGTDSYRIGLNCRGLHPGVDSISSRCGHRLRVRIGDISLYPSLQAMLGSAHNRRKLRGSVAKFVALRRYEQMSSHQALQGIKLSELPFLWTSRRQGEHPQPPSGYEASPQTPVQAIEVFQAQIGSWL